MADITNTWKLYKNSRVEAGKNYKVDNLSDYLQTLTSETVTGGQYIKHGLRITLKIDADQAGLDYFTNANNINYVSIQNTDDTKPVYYFVEEKKWTSEKTITLRLKQDTINSQVGNYTLSNKTSILREHRDRFQKINNNTEVVRRIDYIPEGITPVLFKNGAIEERIKVSETIKDTNFYLVYFKGNALDPDPQENIATPIKILLLSDNPQLTWQEGETVWGDIIVPTTDIQLMSTGAPSLIIMSEQNVSVLPYTGGHVSDFGASAYIESDGTKHVVKLQYDGVNTILYEYIYNSDGTYRSGGENSRNATQYKIERHGGGTVRSVQFKRFPSATMPQTYTNLVQDSTAVRTYVAENITPHYQCSTIKDLDRTLATLVKIIQLPYPPLKFEDIQNGTIIFDTDNWRKANWSDLFPDSENKASIMLTNNWTDQFRCLFESNVDPLEPIKYHPQNPTTSDMRDDINESKLFNSDYYNPKLVYDAFAYNFMLERVNAEEYKNAGHFNIEFAASTQMADSFIFKFEDYKLGDKGIDDYDGKIVVSRNNQVSIYSDAYLNYMRMGYGYDVAQAKRQDTTNAIGLTVSVLAAVGALVATAASGGSLALPAMALAGTTIAGSMNLVTTSMRNDESIQQKINQYKQQGMTEKGCSDVFIVNEYTQNKLKYTRYELSEQTRKAIANLFYYHGYAANYTGQPSETGRVWFNFVQAEIVLSEETNLSDEIIEDIKQKYKEGITVFHKRDNTWDFNQTKENWEVDLVGPEDPLDDLMEDVGEVGAGTGQWSLGHPIYGNSPGRDASMASGQLFRFIVNDAAAEPQYWFEAKDGFNNVYRFIPGVKVVMTRQMDGRTFEKPLIVGRLYRLTSGLTTSNIPLFTPIAPGFLYSETATKNG